MYKVIITFVDGHVYTRLVYANSDYHAHDIVMQGRRYAPPGRAHTSCQVAGATWQTSG